MVRNLVRFGFILLFLFLIPNASRAQQAVVGASCSASGLNAIATNGTPVLCTGSPLVWTAIGSGSATVTLTCGNPTGAINGVNVTFTLPSAPAIPANLLLYHNGLVQIQPTDYSISSATITEVVAPLTGESLSYCYPNNSVAWTANAGTPGGSINGANVTFTLPTAPLTPANLQLYQNGVLQKQVTDYTLAGTTITYITAPASGGNLFYAAYN